MAIGIDWEGRRQVLGVEMANRESSTSWKEFLLGLKRRGLRGVIFAVSDDHPGLKRAISEVLPEAFWQRCYVHFLRNALDYLPRKVADDCLIELRWLYDRRNAEEARRDLAAWLVRWQEKYPKLYAWVEENIEETLTFYRLPREHHKHPKSTNMLERINQELKRRTHVIRIFPNEESCLRLFRALAVEIDEDWIEAHRYLNMEMLREQRKQLHLLEAPKHLLRIAKQKEQWGELPGVVGKIAKSPHKLVGAALRHYVLKQPSFDSTGQPYIGLCGEQSPYSESRIYLGEERDILGMQRTVVDWRLTNLEKHSIDIFSKQLAREFSRLDLGRIELANFQWPDDPSQFGRVLHDSNHHIGTTRMSESPATGVVNSDCKVHDVDNLFIGSSSVFSPRRLFESNADSYRTDHTSGRPSQESPPLKQFSNGSFVQQADEWA